ncbi:peptide-modifying radical SAM enzyme CbpB, partial [bacterium]
MRKNRQWFIAFCHVWRCTKRKNSSLRIVLPLRPFFGWRGYANKGEFFIMKGLTILKNNTHDVLLDANNLFWASMRNNDQAKSFIPQDILKLYGKVKSKLDGEIHDFRFSQELTAIYIDPTDKCNASCPYCYIPDSIRKRGRSMSKEELDFILNKLARHFRANKRKQVIIFHAGEPLLLKEIIFGAIAKYAGNFKFGLQTNAILLQKKDVDFLKKYRVGVGISLDSYSEKTNNRLRRDEKGGNFFKAVQAIEWFNGYKGLNIITTVTKLNVKDLPGIVTFLHKKRVPCVLLNPMRFTRNSTIKLKPDDKVFTKYFINAVNTAMRLSKTTKHKIIVGNFTNTVLAIVAPSARRLMCDISPCGGGRCFFTITAIGDMIPCGEFIGLKGFSGGNIFKDPVQKAMQSEAFKKVRARFVEKIKECDICDFRN